MSSQQVTAEPSATDTVDRDATVGDVVSFPSPVPDTDRRPLGFDVIIAGCGPTGAMLAAELRLHDVRVVVAEQDTEPVSLVRIVGLHIRSLELLAMRGLLDRLLPHRQRPAGGFFAAIDKPSPEGLDSAHAYLLGIPQPVIVEVLAASHRRRLGVRVDCHVVRRPHHHDRVAVAAPGAQRLALRVRHRPPPRRGRS
jgi:2-polyprenyl-6-methoxyphenol hydroxylase-like FAD-dependent oxidoreductase